MRWKTSCWAGSLALLVAAPLTAQTTTLGFDDLPDPGTSYWAVPSGYGGIQGWSGLQYWNPLAYYTNLGSYTDNGYIRGTVSGNRSVWSGSTAHLQNDPGTTFLLQSGYFTGAWKDGMTIAARGYISGSELFFKSFVISAYSATRIQFDWEVDYVTFESSGGTSAGYGIVGSHWALDDLVVGVPQPAIVPEPGTILLLITGLVGLGFMAVRRRRVEELAA